jgi:hypothetical protein
VINYNEDAVPANTIELPEQVELGQMALLVLNVSFLKSNNVLQHGAAVLCSGWGGSEA